MGGRTRTLASCTLTLELLMTQQQLDSGYADRVGARLRAGQLDIMRGRWRVLRKADPRTWRDADGIDTVSVVYHLMPLDAAARGVVDRQQTL